MSVQEFVEAIEYGSGSIFTDEPEQIIADMCSGIDEYVGRAITSQVDVPTTETHVILEDRSIPKRYTLIIYSLGLDGSSIYRQPHGDAVACADAQILKTSLVELLKTTLVANEINEFIV